MTVYKYLTDQEKQEIIVSHIKSNEYNLYNIEVTKVEELASSNPNQSRIDAFDAQISEIQLKLAALTVELAKFVN